MDECDYCGVPGHHWSAHEEARADVAAWRREVLAEQERHYEDQDY